MLTRGTNTDALPTYELRSLIAAAALDVYEAVVLGLGNYEVDFAAGTLKVLTEALTERRPGLVRLPQCAFVGAGTCSDESCIYCYGEAPLRLDPSV